MATVESLVKRPNSEADYASVAHAAVTISAAELSKLVERMTDLERNSAAIATAQQKTMEVRQQELSELRQIVKRVEEVAAVQQEELEGEEYRVESLRDETTILLDFIEAQQNTIKTQQQELSELRQTVNRVEDLATVQREELEGETQRIENLRNDSTVQLEFIEQLHVELREVKNKAPATEHRCMPESLLRPKLQSLTDNFGNLKKAVAELRKELDDHDDYHNTTLSDYLVKELNRRVLKSNYEKESKSVKDARLDKLQKELDRHSQQIGAVENRLKKISKALAP